MTQSDIREKTRGELGALLGEKRARIDELRILLHQKKIKNVKELRAVKKDAARILTLLRNTSYA